MSTDFVFWKLLMSLSSAARKSERRRERKRKTKDGTEPEVRSRLSLFLRGGVIGEGFSVCQ